MNPGFRPAAIVIHPDVDPDYAKLEAAAKAGQKPEQGIWKRFQTALARIRADGQWGEVIRGKDVPKYFRQRYDVANLYCIDLAGDVRCFYTIDERDVIFLDIMDHDRYDKLFGLR